MTNKAAEALEVALWLHRAPSRRVALAGRPLPEGIGELLRVATGGPEQLAAAARVTGEREATVLEAVRFYLQQILFHEDADAYRVLGLRPDATHAQAREHHRLLQHWLHPDRHGPDAWESIYATRVNRAWQHLRTPQARASYDQALDSGAAGPPRAGAFGDGAGAGPLHWERADPAARNGSRSLALLALAGCVALLMAIGLRREAPPQWSDDDAPAPQGPAAPAVQTMATADHDLAASVAMLAESALAGPGATAPDAGVPPQRPVARLATPTRVEAATRPPPAPMRPQPEVVLASAPARPTVGAVAPAADGRAQDLALAPVDPVAAASPATGAPSAVVAAGTPVVVPPPVPDAAARMAQARESAGEVLAYVGGASDASPPVWNDLAAARQADGIRRAVLVRMPSGARIALQAPRWRLGEDGARLASGYEATGMRGRGETGRVTMDFTWREGRLRVHAMSLEPGS